MIKAEQNKERIYSRFSLSTFIYFNLKNAFWSVRIALILSFSDLMINFI